MSRLPMIDDDKLTEEQHRAITSVHAGGKRAGVRGPFPALLRNPELCERTAHLGELLRFGTSLPPRLSEMAILLSGYYWQASYEWYAHAPLAQKGGLSDDILESIRQGKRPAAMRDDEAALYNFCTELHQNKRVSDPTYKKAVEIFGERGAVEILSISGYYVLISMVLNTAEVALPSGVPDPFPNKTL